jgi:hypothetical protein
MERLDLRWALKVLGYAAVAVAILAVDVVWMGRQPGQQPFTAPESVRPYLRQCRDGAEGLSEVHRCEHGWAVFWDERSPTVYDEAGNLLCEARPILGDASATDETIACLRANSDVVGRCEVTCSATVTER